MIEFKNKTYEEFFDEDSSEFYENISFIKCQFNYCDISQMDNPKFRSTIKNVILKNCSSKGGSIGCSVLDNVIIENFKNSGLIQTWGAVFKHVVMKGKLGKIMITDSYNSNNPYIDKAFEEENKLFYSNIDWALDISEGEFIELDIRGIPSNLIKIDNKTQGIIQKDNIPDNWRNINFNDRVTKAAIDIILELNLSDYVYVAPKRAKNFDAMIKDLETLREYGIVDKAY